MFLSVLSVVLLFTIMVSVHELGHLIMAKRAGVFCHEFSIGMGPKLFSFRSGETFYCIRLLPLGGYVKMAGEEERMYIEGRKLFIRFNNDEIIELHEADSTNSMESFIVESINQQARTMVLRDPYSQSIRTVPFADNSLISLKDGEVIPLLPNNRIYQSKSPGKRIAILLAGPLANIILAVFIVAGLNFVSGVPMNDSTVIGSVSSTGANNDVLFPGDEIISINDTTVHSWSEVKSTLSKNTGDIKLEVNRNGDLVDISIKADNTPKIAPELTHSPVQVIPASIEKTIDQTTVLANGFKRLIIGEEPLKNMSGPAGIFKITYDVANQTSLSTFFLWASIMNLNVAIFNLLPLPALDGGRITLTIIEFLRGRALAPKKEVWVHLCGFVFLMGLTVFATWNDIMRFIYH